MVHYVGLSSVEVEKRHKIYGFNLIEEKFHSGVFRFLKKFIQPISLMIELAMLLSIILGKWSDFIVIFILLFINIVVDFWQTKKANGILKSLVDKIAVKSTVIRNNQVQVVNAGELVPGDIIKITIGDVIPADVKLLDEGFLTVDQSQITGESSLVDKKQGDVVYSGSIVQRGLTFAEVVFTGQNSEIGKNVSLVSRANEEKLKNSHFQKTIISIVKFLVITSLFLIVIVFISLILNNGTLLEALRFSLVLVLASIPVALPVVLSVTLAIGAAELAKKNVIVSNSRAIEELAGVDILCIDKTGTLTQNKTKVSLPKAYMNFNLVDLFTYAFLAIDPLSTTSIEHAIYSYATEHKLVKDINKYNVTSFIPFDPIRKTTEVFVESDDEKYKIIMGAPQVVSSYIVDDNLSKIVNEDIAEYSKNGIRVIVVGKETGGVFIPVGIIPMFDPPRDDSKSIIAYLKQLGVKTKMLTGDYIEVANFIAQKISLGTQVVGRTVMKSFYKTKTHLDDYKTILQTDVFAEVIPEDKYKIVSVLQEYNHIVAMTGDGVNDAPALKRSDIGIAVSGSAPAARSSADIVLMTNGLSVIKDALCYARKIFARMESYATFRIAETIRIIFFITFALLFFNFSPLSAIMVILIALLNDIPVIAIAYDNSPMSKKPIRWKMNEMLIVSTVLGIAGLVSSFTLLSILHINGYSILLIQTIMFLKLDVSGHSTLYLTRTGKKHFWQKPYPSLKFFIPAFSSRIVGTILVVYGIFMVSISWWMVLFVWVYSTFWFVLNDQIKVLTYKILDNNKIKKSNEINRVAQTV